MPDKLEQLSQDLEKIYQKLEQTINQVFDLENTLKTLETKSTEVFTKYEALLDTKRLKTMQLDYNKTYDDFMERTEKIDHKLTVIENARFQTVSRLEQAYARIENQEKRYKDSMKKIDRLNTKLSELQKSIDKQRRVSDKHLFQAEGVYKMLKDYEDFESLKQLQEENNKLLKELIKHKQVNNKG